VKRAWASLHKSACFFVAVKSRLATFDQLLADKLSRLERYFAVKCLKIAPEIGNSKLYALKANVSIFEKLLVECM
jgi:hypothetical protein